MTTAFFARARMRSMASRLRPVPVGLFGLERRTARVCGRDGVEDFLQRKLHRGLRVGDFDDLGAGHLGVEAVHGVGGLEDEDFLAVIDVGVDEDLDGFVGAVGEDELVGRDVEVAGDGLLGGGVFGIDGEVGGGEVRLEDSR